MDKFTVFLNYYFDRHYNTFTLFPGFTFGVELKTRTLLVECNYSRSLYKLARELQHFYPIMDDKNLPNLTIYTPAKVVTFNNPTKLNVELFRSILAFVCKGYRDRAVINFSNLQPSSNRIIATSHIINHDQIFYTHPRWYSECRCGKDKDNYLSIANIKYEGYVCCEYSSQDYVTSLQQLSNKKYITDFHGKPCLSFK